MTPEQQKALEEHLEAISQRSASRGANILYQETKPEQLESLAKIEATVRDQTLEYITPQIGFFCSSKLQARQLGESKN